jgi:hypothetical protein
VRPRLYIRPRCIPGLRPAPLSWCVVAFLAFGGLAFIASAVLVFGGCVLTAVVIAALVVLSGPPHDRDGLAWGATVVAVLLLALGVVLAVGPGIAQAQTAGGYLDGDNIGADLGDGSPAAPGAAGGAEPAADAGTGPGADSGPVNPLQWQRQRVVGYECRTYDNGTTGVNSVDAPPLPPGAPGVAKTGTVYRDVLIDTRTGEPVPGVRATQVCVYPDEPAPPLPPAPPSSAEVRDRAALPVPGWGVSPTGDGMVGMTTLLWDTNGGGGRSVTVTIRGYTVTTQAAPEAWRWTMAEPGERGAVNPNPVVGASRAGSATDPAASYTYETAGDYTLTLRVTWRGSYTFSGNGVPGTTVDLGTIVRSSSRPYHVAYLLPVLEGLATT